MSQRIAAIVPMRHDSERVAGKNYRPLGGRPLFHHILVTLLATPEVGEVYVDTDSDLIREDVGQSFPAVQVLERPPHLRAGDVPMNDVLAHDVRRIDADIYLQTHSTNPFLRSATITAAIRAFREASDHDSLFGVTRLQTRLWDADGQPINHDRERLIRTQDLAPVFEENSTIYLFTRESLERQGNRIGARPLMFEVPPDEALDIDDERDFQLADALVAGRAAP